MNKLIIALVIIACATIAQAQQSFDTLREQNRKNVHDLINNQRQVPAWYPSSRYNEPMPHRHGALHDTAARGDSDKADEGVVKHQS